MIVGIVKAADEAVGARVENEAMDVVLKDLRTVS